MSMILVISGVVIGNFIYKWLLDNVDVRRKK